MEKSSNKNSYDNLLRVERIEELMKAEGYQIGSKKEGCKNQKDFADAIGIEPQNFSRAMNSGKISEKLCKKIVTAFPDWQIEYLLGYNSVAKRQQMKDLSADSYWCLFEQSLQKQGKTLKFVHRSGQHVDSSERLHADCYYSVQDLEGHELKRLTARQLIELEQKLQEYCDFITGKYL